MSSTCNGTYLASWWVYMAAAGGSWCAGLLGTLLLRSVGWLCCPSGAARERDLRQRLVRKAHAQSTLYEADAATATAMAAGLADAELDYKRRRASGCEACAQAVRNALVRVEQLAEKLRSGESLVGKMYNLADVVCCVADWLAFLLETTLLAQDVPMVPLYSCGRGWYAWADIGFNAAFLAFGVLRFLGTTNKLLFWWSLRTMVDCVTIPQVLYPYNTYNVQYIRTYIITKLTGSSLRWGPE